jgi:BirA family transcriptional regulator, biotin operon repressor / biotin---[acetyl-CoA-carboxylase] ligase
LLSAYDEPALPSAAELGLSAMVHLNETTSTMDEAHALARRGEPAGVLVIADRQSAGRGRGGNSWSSRGLSGLWMTLLERPSDASMLRVLSLRLGLVIAEALQQFSDDRVQVNRVQVKWPNDLLTARGKLGGILVEARWRESTVDWVAIGVGINLTLPPAMSSAAALRSGTSRASLLRAVVPVVRAALQGGAVLSATELDAWHSRDFAAGRRIVAPVAGQVRGIAADGALLVREPGLAHDTAMQTGSMIFEESPV